MHALPTQSDCINVTIYQNFFVQWTGLLVDVPTASVIYYMIYFVYCTICGLECYWIGDYHQIIGEK
jgi:hypothetical protein